MNENILKKYNLILSKYIKSDRINHSYLIETNYGDKIALAKELANKIISLDGIQSLRELELNGDLIIIDDEQNTIKTEEIDKIKDSFITKSLNNSKRIYIINNIENLNIYSANKLLKFLEEPEDDIIAILLTSNKNNVLETILSRCFLIRFFITNNNNEDFDDEYLDKLFCFVNNIEDNKEKAIAFQNINNIKEITERGSIKKFLNALLLVYDDVIKYKYINNSNLFFNRIDNIKNICEKNDIDSIQRKVNSICESIDKLSFNPNIKLLIDKLIIDMSGVE